MKSILLYIPESVAPDAFVATQNIYDELKKQFPPATEPEPVFSWNGIQIHAYDTIEERNKIVESLIAQGKRVCLLEEQP